MDPPSPGRAEPRHQDQGNRASAPIGCFAAFAAALDGLPKCVRIHRKLEGNAKVPDLFCSRSVIGYYQFGNMDTPVAPRRARADAGDNQRRRERSSGSVEQLSSLTPLRGVAALWVVIFHFCWHIPTIHPERYTGAVYKGYLAVDVFFVLSGFVIT